MGLRNRLENLVANPLLVESPDYQFAKSLLEYYRRKGHLTAGRRPWLDKLEMKYDPANYVNPLEGNPTGDLLQTLLANESVGARDRDFLTSLKNGLARYGSLSDRQLDALNRVSERYSPEGEARREAWAEKYASVKNEAVIAASYYEANPPYYGDLASRILRDPDFVPSEKQFNAITQNKYAQKVIAATISEPLYAEGTLVEGRASASPRLRGKKAFVLKTNHGPVTNAAKGTKKYLVLPVGEPSPVVVEEREIKRVKKLKKK